MHGLPYLVYHLLKGMLLLALPFYYPGTRVCQRAYLRVKGPTLVVSNHPNTLMDPLNIVIRINRPVFFLANASLFKNPLAARILGFLFTLPVERAQDVSGRPVQNAKNFEAVIRHLQKEGNIWIAPEGGSERAWQVRPLKTGLARLALQALEELPEPDRLTILPVGLTYGCPGQPGGGLVVMAGPPIRVNAFASSYREGRNPAIRQLMRAVEAQLHPLLVHCPDAEAERRLRWADQLAQSRQPLSGIHRFHRLQLGAHRLTTWPAERRKAWEQKADALRRDLAQANIAPHRLTSRPLWPPEFLDVLLLLAGMPLALWGLLNNLLPMGLPWLIRHRLQIDKEYDDTLLVLAGLVTVPLFYGMQALFAARWLSAPGLVLYLLSLPLLAYLAWYYAGFARARLRTWVQGKDASASLRRNWMEQGREVLDLFHTD